MGFTFDDLTAFTVKNTREKHSKWDGFISQAQQSPGEPVLIPASAGTYMTQPKKEGAVPQERSKALRDESSITTALRGTNVVMYGGKKEGVSKKLYIPTDSEMALQISTAWASRPDADSERLLVADNPQTGAECYVAFAIAAE